MLQNCTEHKRPNSEHHPRPVSRSDNFTLYSSVSFRTHTQHRRYITLACSMIEVSIGKSVSMTLTLKCLKQNHGWVGG